MILGVAMLKVEKQTKWIGYLEFIVGLGVSLLAHIPIFFQYHVYETKVYIQQEEHTTANNITINCTLFVKNNVTETTEWVIYNVVTHSLIRVLPTVFIIALNVSMILKIRELFATRKRLFKNQITTKAEKEVTRLKTISGNHLSPSSITTTGLAGLTDERRSSSTKIVKKIVQKW
jgi:hypothetical protein